jgi:hypothetical protein
VDEELDTITRSEFDIKVGCVDEELALIPYKTQCYAGRRVLNESRAVIYIANTFQ